ncbi:MAG: acetolactate synthase small subunit [Gammaproteobacteria bacterium]|nr:acetolactate synthase small subunit [Gammaproteobacteria bacterium]MCY4165856.1 acetolactate synthase small subunit [Gammaproteobacteria bacterium]MCY4256162.1 acetolactate synthase small subunit [Gammaproteobacteria bacterium]MCY4339963.1 acetolactate synthase small subunit [Gammaproteobacteria bacterium]
MNEEAITLTPQQLIRKRAAGEPVEAGAAPDIEQHIINVLLENSMGALIRVVNMFSARGFNLDSVTVGVTEDPTVSRLCIVTRGSVRVISQILRQLNRLVDTIEVDDLTGTDFVERELCIIKVRCRGEKRADVLQVNEIFRGRVVDVTPDILALEIVGPTKKVDAFVNLMKPHGIDEVARSGRVAMQRAPQPEDGGSD